MDSTRSSPEEPSFSVALGWICFGVGLLAFQFFGLGMAFFVCAGVVGIFAIARGRMWPGVALLGASILTPVLCMLGVLGAVVASGTTAVPAAGAHGKPANGLIPRLSTEQARLDTQMKSLRENLRRFDDSGTAPSSGGEKPAPFEQVLRKGR